MDTVALTAWNAIPAPYQGYIGLFLLSAFLLSHFLANTDTPPPNTPWGKVYAVLELIGGLYGKAKQIGIPEPTAQDILKRLTDHIQTGQPITAENITTVLGVNHHA